jgi:hypothetical protein
MAEQKLTCIVCGKSNAEIPLLALDFNGQKYWLCPQELPTLIHEPQKLIGKLPGSEHLKGHAH